MKDLTLDTIASNLIWLGAFIGAILLILKYCKNIFENVITKPILEKMDKNKSSLQKQINDLSNEVQTLGINQCQNFLVSYLSDVENGEPVTEMETKRAYDIFDKYTNEYHGNSYIHSWWNKVVERGKNK